MPIPYIPQNLILQTGNGQNLVTWDIVAGAISYTVQRSTDGVNFAFLGNSVVNSYVDLTCVVGHQYYYQVASVNAVGTSGYASPYPLSITPCLPGQINLGYLRYMSQLAADKLNSFYLTTDEWNFNINQSATELYDILITKFGDDYFFAPYLLIPLNGSISYSIPDGSNYPINGINSPALYKLNGIDANISGAGNGPNAAWVPLARTNWINRDDYSTWPGQSGVLNNVYQMSYRPMGNQIFFFPQNINMLVRVWYVPMLSQMLLDTDMLSFSISGWSQYVIVDAAMKAMSKEKSGEKWLLLNNQKDKLMERIEATAANRDVGQNNAVSNTRATVGDPSFSCFGTGWGGGLGGSNWG